MKYVHSKHSGFSLIEVMLAVLVLSIGILAVSKLQTGLIKSGSDANYRATAASIAQKKINDLRRFVYVTTSDISTPIEWDSLAANSVTSLKYPLSLAFAHIENNKGGRIQAGDISNGNNTFTLSWTSDDYYYSTVNSIATLTAVADDPSFKKIHIVVQWDGVGDNTNSIVSFDTIIDSYNFVNSNFGGSTVTGGTGPVVNYDPLSAPDVIPVELGIGDLMKETSKPLPDVSKKGDSTLVQFETVTYDTNNDTQRREEFRTLACNCKTPSGPSTPNTSIIYGYVTWDSTEETIVDITTTIPTSISKWEVDNSGGELQDDACTFCCRDGADLAGDFKVCRLKRIDGVLRIIDPWKLVAFNMIPASYFNDSNGISTMTSTLQNTNIDLYSSYVTTTVRNILAATGSKNALANYSTVDISFIDDTSSFTNNSGAIEHLLFNQGSGNNRNIQVRGIYMDYPPSGIFTQITNQTTYYSAADVPLDRVPFYEVNLTQLAGWTPDVWNDNAGNDTGDTTFDLDYTNNHDEMDNSCIPQHSASGLTRNYVTNEEFFEDAGGNVSTCNNASRGDFYPIATTSIETITSEIFTNSDGIVDRNINTNTTIDVSLDLEVQ